MLARDVLKLKAKGCQMNPNPDYDASDELEYGIAAYAWLLRGVYPPPAYAPDLDGQPKSRRRHIGGRRGAQLPDLGRAVDVYRIRHQVVGRVLVVGLHVVFHI